MTITYIRYYFVWFCTTIVRYGMVRMVVVTGAVCHEQEACGTRHETRGIVVPSIVSVPVADRIVDDGAYYLLRPRSTVRLL